MERRGGSPVGTVRSVQMDHVVKHFDQVADVYDEVLPFFSDFARTAVELLGPEPGSSALDVAAGRGAMTSELLARGVQVTAIDGSPRMVELLTRDHPQANAYVRDAGRLELPSEGFDLVVCAFAIHIITDPYAALDEMIRVLKPGRQIALIVPGRADGEPDPWPDPLVDLYAEYRRYQADGVGRHGNDVEESDLLAESSLVDVAARTIEVAIPVPDGETYWRWSRSHGSGRFIDGLPEDKRTEMHEQLLVRLSEIPDFVLRRSATMWTASKPG